MSRFLQVMMSTKEQRNIFRSLVEMQDHELKNCPAGTRQLTVLKTKEIVATKHRISLQLLEAVIERGLRFNWLAELDAPKLVERKGHNAA